MAHSKRNILDSVLDGLHRANVSKDSAILVAVSGGVDSVVLANILATLLRKKYFRRLGIAHLNHKLRGKDADNDEAFVRSLAERLGVEYFSEAAHVSEFAKKNKLGIEEAGRTLRYDYFKRICEREKFHYVATAHHADDRIETIFMNIARGTGLRGLIGIPRTRSLTKNVMILRPLLEKSRLEIEAYARKHKLRWREDKSNSSDAYTRNRIRKYVVPQLKKSLPTHKIYDGVAHLVESAEAAQSYIDSEARKVRSRALVKDHHLFFSELPLRKFKLSILDNTPLIIIRELVITECE